MNTMPNRALTIFLLLMIAGASFFCIFTNTSPMEHGDKNTPANQSTTEAHILHAKELAQAVITTAPFAQAVYSLIVFIVALGFFRELDFSQKPIPLTYLRRRRRSILPIAQVAVRSWLSRIERSPNILRPA